MISTRRSRFSRQNTATCDCRRRGKKKRACYGLGVSN